jgi:tRNA A-37 threonylcarbamoyl transferase component Bud32
MMKMTPQRDQQIMELFLAATELRHDQRASFLDKQCGNDQELRRELDSLLRHHIPETDGAEGGDTRRDDPPAITSLQKLTSSSRFPRARLGVTGFLLAVTFAALWFFAHRAVQSNLRNNAESQLKTVLNADVAAIEIWLAKQKQMSDRWASDDRVRRTLQELARRSSEQELTTSQLESTDAHEEFLHAIGPLLAHPEISFVGVFARDGHGIAKCPDPPVQDVYWSSQGAAMISPCFRGETIFMPTFRPGSNVVGTGRSPVRSAAISVVAPVNDDRGNAIAAMQLIMKIDEEFATLFSMARIGRTGESYAFDRRGVVLSGLRRESELHQHGLIPGDGGAALNLHLRDPGIDLRDHSASVADLVAKPLCRVPALAIEDGEALDSLGYRNYLGVKVVGAARWLPDYDFGVVTEIEHDEAFAPLRSLGRVFATVFGMLSIAAIAAVLLSIKNSLLKNEIKRARQLGKYRLKELIGQGGMAKVYRAQHAVLRRPTAIKLIEQREATEAMVARFEREAQLASELTHPNTIQIYDYGRTEEGVFYFAMEFLPGVSLADLVIREGALPPARVVHILRQVCGALAEAHQRGMIHRDVKPANIMLCELGGQYDVVKVLDFGLVKSIATSDLQATGNQELTGTPLYIAPERIRRSASVDNRSDIYSVGTVAFYLLTSEFLFDGETSADVLYCVVNQPPRCPSEAAMQEIPAPLDELVLSCLQKDPQDRPPNMAAVIEVLDSLALANPWTQGNARNANMINATDTAPIMQPAP